MLTNPHNRVEKRANTTRVIKKTRVETREREREDFLPSSLTDDQYRRLLEEEKKKKKKKKGKKGYDDLTKKYEL